MFVPLRYKLAIGASPRVRVSQAQQIGGPRHWFQCPERDRRPSETQVALTDTRSKARRGDICYAVGVAGRDVALMGARLKARWGDTATPQAWQEETESPSRARE